MLNSHGILGDMSKMDRLKDDITNKALIALAPTKHLESVFRRNRKKGRWMHPVFFNH